MPSEKLAGMMAAAIVSDTVMFKSPTCTQRDRSMAERMARIANVSLEELGQQIFSASWSDDKTPEELLFTDFKDFHIAGHDLGVGQITCVNSAHILERKQELLDIMQQTMQERHYGLILLMLTDVLLEGTQLAVIGDEETIQQAFSSEAQNNVVFLPGVMSRKKQYHSRALPRCGAKPHPNGARRAARQAVQSQKHKKPAGPFSPTAALFSVFIWASPRRAWH